MPKLVPSLSFLLVHLALSGCGGEESSPESVPISIRFSGLVGREPFQCGRTYQGVGLSGASVTPRDFRFYVHDVRLVTEDGKRIPVGLDEDAFQYRDVALLDFEDGSGECADGDPELHTAVTGAAPDHAYRGVEFRLGVPFELNHAPLDSQPAPLNKSSMYWDWMGGHLFLVATSHAVMTTERSTETMTNDHFTHVGSTACTGDPENGVAVTSCRRPNRGEYSLDGFDPRSGAVSVDFGAIKAGTDVMASKGCHSFTEATCKTMFDNLGLDWATGEAKTGQTVFEVE